ncbi:probable purine permease 4 [Syzygium oleosum]|uniref:probable purine permease 4 n=1 Tax=Syzygium oleosum TaxID=219896 RepID=UPI0011D27E99|nr:probable purine permease 4 [Syzygium oleosum]
MQPGSSPNHHHHSPTLNDMETPDHKQEHSSVLSLAASEGRPHKTGNGYVPLLVISALCLFVGSVSSSLLAKYYFIHKGSSRWVSTWVQCAGFPLLVPFIYVPYFLKRTQRRPFTHFTRKLWVMSVFVGLMLGINNLLFSWGTSYLPVSTSSLLLSTQLLFNLILSVLIVKQKITFSNLNCVILLTLSSVLLALSESRDRPPGLTRAKYFIGFLSTVGAGLLFALYLPVMEKIYKKVYCYAMVIEMQLVMEIAATALATVGMVADGGFAEMKREGERVFDRGARVYCATVAMTVVCWQMCFMGTAGMVFMTSSLTGGVCMTALLALNVLAGVVVYQDDFGGVKIVSTVLCMWGFCSYVYGMHMMNTKRQGTENKPSVTTASTSPSNCLGQAMEMASLARTPDVASGGSV